MIQYTTPTLPLLVEGVDIINNGSNVYVTFRDKLYSKLLTIENPVLTPHEKGTLVTVHFTQKQTGDFSPEVPVEVQVNWVLPDGERMATEVALIFIHENLIKEVISYD